MGVHNIDYDYEERARIKVTLMLELLFMWECRRYH